MAVLKPPRLAPGMTIGLVAPASNFEESEIAHAAVETIESLGFRVKLGKHLFYRYGYFAGTDQERAADLNAMFADPAIHGIITLRGGYGSSRLLPLLDYATIQRQPKVLLGYSDITSLLLGIHGRTGLVTFHGPIGDQPYTPYTLAEFQRVLMTPQEHTQLGAPPPFTPSPGRVERTNRVARMIAGKAHGPLLGGNLTLVTHLLGTPYLPDLTGAILFLEDIHETVYRVDRMLTQLALAGELERVAGIVFGKFTDCRPSPGRAHGFTLEEVLTERCRALGVPVVRGLMIGHVDDQTTIPIGCRAELDADKGTLTLLEAAVE